METTIPFALLAILIGYLCGSVSFAIVIGKMLGKPDVRTLGSGNAGFTNVLRNYGRGPAITTLVGDTLKGTVGVLLGFVLFSLLAQTDPWAGGYFAGFGAVFGHIYPVYFGFRGGKAVLVSAGALLVLQPITLAILLTVFLLVTFTSKIISLGSVTVAVLAPFVTLGVQFFLNRPFLPACLFSGFIGFYITYLHRANIKRLLAGTEPKFTKRPSSS